MAPEYNCNHVQCNAHLLCCASTGQMINRRRSSSIMLLQVSELLLMAISFHSHIWGFPFLLSITVLRELSDETLHLLAVKERASIQLKLSCHATNLITFCIMLELHQWPVDAEVLLDKLRDNIKHNKSIYIWPINFRLCCSNCNNIIKQSKDFNTIKSVVDWTEDRGGL